MCRYAETEEFLNGFNADCELISQIPDHIRDIRTRNKKQITLKRNVLKVIWKI